MSSSRPKSAQSLSEADAQLVALARVLGRCAAREAWGGSEAGADSELRTRPDVEPKKKD